MILIDLNQIIFATVLPSLINQKTKQIDDDVIRHIVFNNIRYCNTKFRAEYKEIVIANDSTNCWRKQVFPYYKAQRKKAREQVNINWKQFFDLVGEIKSELSEYFPYKFIEVDGCEADDIIAVICRNPQEKTLIISSDKDYIQLHNDLVEQYDLVNKRYVRSDNPARYLFDHIVNGDRGDGIPNICSSDNCFVTNQRQKKVTKSIVAIAETIDDNKNSELYRNYMRNKTLIDMRMIPDNIVNAIEQKIASAKRKDRQQLMMYFSKKRMRQLQEQLNDF